MFVGIDHVIIGVSDLERASATFGEKLGLTVSGGGTHPSGGTGNSIIVIADTYLELITIHEPGEAQLSMLARLAKGDGYVNFVLGSNDLKGDSQAMKERGVPIIGPNPGSLQSTNGQIRSWTRVDIERPDMAQSYPFLIQHDSSGDERRFRLAGWQAPPEHPLGAVGVYSTTIAVANLEEATRRFEHIYGIRASEPFVEEEWNARLVSFALGTGKQYFELAAPLDTRRGATGTPSTPPRSLADAGGLAHHLATFGESLCRMRVSVRDMDEAQRYLDAHNVTHTYRGEKQAELWIASDQSCGAALVLRKSRVLN